MNSSRRFHIVLDAMGVDSNKLSDEKFVIDLITDIRDAVDMKFLVSPKVAHGDPTNPGLTAFAIIDFSHISVHTFTKTRELCLDVFSCKKFDYLALYTLVKGRLGVADKDIRRAIVSYNNKPKI